MCYKTYGTFALQTNLDIEEIFISFTWALNVTYRTDCMVNLDIEGYSGFILTLWLI